MARKSLREEMDVIRRYADLTEPYFKLLKTMLESADKKEQMWAAEQLKNAFPKFIPQQIEGADGGAITIKLLQFGTNDTLQLDTGTPPITDTPEQSPVQDSGLAPQGPQDHTGD